MPSSNTPKKIVSFFDFANLAYGGGCEKNFMKLGLWLQKKGYDVNFVTPSLQLNKKLGLLPGITEYKANISTEDLEKIYNIKDNYKVFDLVDIVFNTNRRKNIEDIFKKSDVIISKNEIFEILLLKFIFKIDFSKVVVGFHTPLHYPSTKSIKSKLHNLLYSSKFYIRLLGNARVRYLVLTNRDKEILNKDHLNGSIAVIPNPLDTSFFSLKNYKERKPKFQVYFIGRMTEQKGVDILALAIDALSVETTFSDMEFNFVGSGEDQAILMNVAKKYSNCRFQGYKTEVVPLYHEADVVVVPSRWEGFPYAVMEAQACGVPVITSDIPGSKDIVSNGKTGWIISSENSADLASTISSAYYIWQNDFQQFIGIGMAARSNIFENFEENNINNKIESFIFRLN